jgi:YD repeat-containing protein
MTDREEAGFRGSVRTYVKEVTYPTGKSLTTTEYGPDGRLLTIRTSNSDGSEWFTTKTYDADGRLVKTVSGKSGEPATETLYAYDEAGRLKEIRDADGKGNRTSYRYDEEGRKTEIKAFAPEVFERNRKGVIVAGSQWDGAQTGVGALEGGSVTTLYDERDLPIELQILNGDGRVVRRFVRIYDANGRIIGENQIQDNPALLMVDRFSGEAQEKLDDKQLKAMNKAMKAMMSGKNGTGISFVYDSQGRLTEVRDRNWALDSVTTTSYNEHGDKSEERMTATSNLAFPAGVAYTTDEEGTLIPDRREGVSDPPPPVPDDGVSDPGPELERPPLTIIEFRYEYDQHGNWTEQTVVYRQEPYEQSTVYRRTLTYF